MRFEHNEMSFFKRSADDVAEDARSIFGSGKGLSKLLNMVRDSVQDRAQFEQLTAADSDVDGGISEIFAQTADKIAVMELKHGAAEWIPTVFVVKHAHMYVPRPFLHCIFVTSWACTCSRAWHQ